MLWTRGSHGSYQAPHPSEAADLREDSVMAKPSEAGVLATECSLCPEPATILQQHFSLSRNSWWAREQRGGSRSEASRYCTWWLIHNIFTCSPMTPSSARWGFDAPQRFASTKISIELEPETTTLLFWAPYATEWTGRQGGEDVSCGDQSWLTSWWFTGKRVAVTQRGQGGGWVEPWEAPRNILYHHVQWLRLTEDESMR